MPRKISIREEDWRLPLKDGHAIYGSTASSPAKNNKAAVVFAHGLASHMYEHIYQAAVPRFVSAGYDCIRFNFYGGEADARRLRDCLAEIHAEDLKVVLKRKAHEYKRIFVVGHSLGGLAAALCNDPKVTAYCMWDPTYDFVSVGAVGWGGLLKHTGRDYLLDCGIEHVISARMVHDDNNYDRSRCREIARELKAPVQVLTAGDGVYGHRSESWNTFAPKGGRLIIVKGADHDFSSLASVEKLHKLSLEWFNKFR